VEEAVKMDPAIQAVNEKMKMIAGDPALVHAYDMLEMARIDYKMGIQGARQDGEKRKAREVARNLKFLGIATDQISSATGLSYEEIAKL
jgi:predicted transposase/invertase (TIGR01784 family)